MRAVSTSKTCAIGELRILSHSSSVDALLGEQVFPAGDVGFGYVDRFGVFLKVADDGLAERETSLINGSMVSHATRG